MSKRIIASVVVLVSAVLFSVPVLASGSGHHSHEPEVTKVASDANVITYKDSKDGIDAYLEFCDFVSSKESASKGFVVKCHVKAFLKNAETGHYVTPTKLALRATVGHDQFGEAKVMLPVEDDRLQTDLIVKKKGEQHYLLIAEIPEVGVREFHFHHVY